MNTERFRTHVFVAILLIALGLCLALLWPFWRALAWAVVLAILIYPMHKRIRMRIPSPNVAATISTILTILFIVVPLGLIVVAITAESIGMVRYTRDFIAGGGWREWAPNLQRGPADEVIGWIGNYVDLTRVNVDEIAQAYLSRTLEWISGVAVLFAQNVVITLIQLVLALFALFFLLRDGQRLLPAVKAFIPLNEDQTDTVLSRAVETMYATFYGVVLVAVVQGALGGLAFSIVGLPSPLLWGAVMAVLCILPLLGAPFVWGPAAFILAMNGEYGKAIFLTLWGALVVGLIDNVTRPFIIGGRTALHPLAVFFAILGGMLALGFVGIFLGPVLLSVTLALLDILRIKLTPPPPGPPAASEPDDDLDVIGAPEKVRPKPHREEVTATSPG